MGWRGLGQGRRTCRAAPLAHVWLPTWILRAPNRSIILVIVAIGIHVVIIVVVQQLKHIVRKVVLTRGEGCVSGENGG